MDSAPTRAAGRQNRAAGGAADGDAATATAAAVVTGAATVAAAATAASPTPTVTAAAAVAPAAVTGGADGADGAAAAAAAAAAAPRACGMGKRRRRTRPPPPDTAPDIPGTRRGGGAPPQPPPSPPRARQSAAAVAPPRPRRPTGRRRRQRSGSVVAGWGTLLAAVGVAAVSAAAAGAGDAAAVAAVPPPVGGSGVGGGRGGGGGGVVGGGCGGGGGNRGGGIGDGGGGNRGGGSGGGGGDGRMPGALPLPPDGLAAPVVRQKTRLPPNFCSAAPVDRETAPPRPRRRRGSTDKRVCTVLVSAQADDGFILYVDGVKLMSSDDWRPTVAKNVEAGPGSVVAVTACNVGGGGDDDQAYAKVDIHFEGNVLISDASWKSSDRRPPGADATVWTSPAFDDSAWPNATLPELLGNVAPGLGPPRAKGIWTARKGPAQRVYLRSPPLPDGFCGPDGPRGQPGATAVRDPSRDRGGVPVWGIAVAAVGGLSVASLALLGAVYLWCWPWGGGVYRVDEWHLFPPTTEGAAALDEEEARRVGASGGGVSAAEPADGRAVRGVAGGSPAAVAAVAATTRVGVGGGRIPAAATAVVVGGHGSDDGVVKPAAAAAELAIDYSENAAYQTDPGDTYGSDEAIDEPTSSPVVSAVGGAPIPRPPTDGSRAPWFNG